MVDVGCWQPLSWNSGTETLLYVVRLQQNTRLISEQAKPAKYLSVCHSVYPAQLSGQQKLSYADAGSCVGMHLVPECFVTAGAWRVATLLLHALTNVHPQWVKRRREKATLVGNHNGSLCIPCESTRYTAQQCRLTPGAAAYCLLLIRTAMSEVPYIAEGTHKVTAQVQNLETECQNVSLDHDVTRYLRGRHWPPCRF